MASFAILRAQSDARSAVTQQIMATHSPDGREFNVHPLLRVVDNIIHQPTFIRPSTFNNNETGAQLGLVGEEDDTFVQDGFPEELVYIVNRVYVEISTKSLAGGDMHAITLEVSRLLPAFAWQDKVVISLAAYMVKYSEFWLVAQSHQTLSCQLANSLAILMSLPNMTEPQQQDNLRLKFEKLTKLIEIVLDLTMTIGEIQKVQRTEDLSTSTSTLNEILATAAYWGIYMIVACFSQITSSQCRYISSTTKDIELCELVDKLDGIRRQTGKNLALYYENTAYQDLVKLYQAGDTYSILRVLCNAEKDDLPLFDGTSQKKVSIEMLNKKYVLLYISLWDRLEQDMMLHSRLADYVEAVERPREFEVLWVPVVNHSGSWNEAYQTKYENLVASWAWHSVCHLPRVRPAGIRFIEEVWHFNRVRPLLVIIDPQGKVANPDAFPMFMIWGDRALSFPVVPSEEALWAEATGPLYMVRLMMILLMFGSLAIEGLHEGKCICFYGGDDMDWVRNFISTAKKCAASGNIPLELCYLGKSNPDENVLRNIARVATEKLSQTLPDELLCGFFWDRLEVLKDSISNFVSSGKRTADIDWMQREVSEILIYGQSGKGWASFIHGWFNNLMVVRADGKDILACLAAISENGDQYWKKKAKHGFLEALEDKLGKARAERDPTRRAIFSDTIGEFVDERVGLFKKNLEFIKEWIKQ